MVSVFLNQLCVYDRRTVKLLLIQKQTANDGLHPSRFDSVSLEL